MKFRIAVSAMCLVALAVVMNVRAAEEASKQKVNLEKVKCVVSGKPVKADATADYKDGKVYFCCPGCPDAFAKGKEKFAAKANHQLVATKQAKQEKCPISGQKTKAGTTVKIAGVGVDFCCKNCKGKAEKAEGEAQVKLVFNDKAFKKAFKVAKAEKATATK